MYINLSNNIKITIYNNIILYISIYDEYDK